MLSLQFAANYARDKLISNINEKIVDLKDLLAGKASTYQNDLILKESGKKKNDNKRDEKLLDRRKSFRKVASTSLTDDCMKKAIEVTDPELLDKLDSITPITREVGIQYKQFSNILNTYRIIRIKLSI